MGEISIETIWEQKGIKEWPISWRPHGNKLHMMIDVMCELSLIGNETNRK